MRGGLEAVLDAFVGAEGRTEFDTRGYLLDAELPDIDLSGVPGGEQLMGAFEELTGRDDDEFTAAIDVELEFGSAEGSLEVESSDLTGGGTVTWPVDGGGGPVRPAHRGLAGLHGAGAADHAAPGAADGDDGAVTQGGVPGTTGSVPTSSAGRQSA